MTTGTILSLVSFALWLAHIFFPKVIPPVQPPAVPSSDSNAAGGAAATDGRNQAAGDAGHL